MNTFLPILTWLPGYRREWLRPDLIAGLTVAIMLIPQSLAYALLVGLPPIVGLYAALAPPIIYTLMGTCRNLSIGPVALDSILVAAGIGAIASPDGSDYYALAITLAFIVGAIQLALGLFRMGFLVDFLSNPVISGFTSSAAVIISLSQMGNLMGIEIPITQQAHVIIQSIFEHLGVVNYPTLAVGLFCLIGLFLMGRFVPRIPKSLIVVSISTVMVWAMELNVYGVKIIGAVPRGLPELHLPAITLTQLNLLLPTAIAVAFVGFMEAFAVAKRISARQSYEVDADQELRTLGVANFSAGVLGGYPVAGSFSRTAVNALSGGKTQLSSLVTAIFIAFTLFFLTPLLYYMPKASFAAVIIFAVAGLIDLVEARRLFKVKRTDFYVMLFSFTATLVVGIQNGILLSVVASIIMILKRITRPHIALMGEIPHSDVIRNVKRAPEAEYIKGLIIIRMDASFYFANIGYFKDSLYKAISERTVTVHAIIIDGSSINEIDSSADTALQEMVDAFAEENIELYITNLKGPVRDVINKSGLYQKLGKSHFFYHKKDAVKYYRKKQIAKASQ